MSGNPANHSTSTPPIIAQDGSTVGPGLWYIAEHGSEYTVVSVYINQLKDNAPLMVFMLDHEGWVPAEELTFLQRVPVPDVRAPG